MLQLDPPSDDSRSGELWRTLGRHQIGALIATSVDFAAMIACVQWLGLFPVSATAVGATAGATTNFTLARAWVFPRNSGHLALQGVRYGMVAFASAGLNTLGEHLVHDRARVQYVVARVLVSLAVSLLWNFPMQRHFVFQKGGAG